MTTQTQTQSVSESTKRPKEGRPTRTPFNERGSRTKSAWRSVVNGFKRAGSWCANKLRRGKARFDRAPKWVRWPVYFMLGMAAVYAVHFAFVAIAGFAAMPFLLVSAAYGQFVYIVAYHALWLCTIVWAFTVNTTSPDTVVVAPA